MRKLFKASRSGGRSPTPHLRRGDCYMCNGQIACYSKPMNLRHKFPSVPQTLLVLVVLSTSLNLVFACEPLGSYQTKVTATKWMISSSGGYPSYSNQNEYIFIFRNFKSPALCSPDSYYVKKSLFLMVITLVAIMIIMVWLRRSKSGVTKN